MAERGPDQDANLATGERFCREAASMGADIALFPEMWNIGYTRCPKDEARRGQWLAGAIDAAGSFVSRHRELARELRMAIAITYLERGVDLPRNVVSLIDGSGEIVLTQAKVHVCEFDWEAALAPGDEFAVATLDTAAGPVEVGAMICYDREFPESARVLMLKGAEIILTPNACTLDENRVGQFRARAFENMTGVAMANYPAPKCNGRSIAFDGMAYGRDERERDMLLIEAGPDEGISLATFDLAALRAYREYETMGNAYRRPRAYGPLVSEEVRPPFRRSNARR